jgi:hypothetical protein
MTAFDKLEWRCSWLAPPALGGLCGAVVLDVVARESGLTWACLKLKASFAAHLSVNPRETLGVSMDEGNLPTRQPRRWGRWERRSSPGDPRAQPGTAATAPGVVGFSPPAHGKSRTVTPPGVGKGASGAR